MTAGSPWFRATNPPEDTEPDPAPPAYGAQAAPYGAAQAPEAPLGDPDAYGTPQAPQEAYEAPYEPAYQGGYETAYATTRAYEPISAPDPGPAYDTPSPAPAPARHPGQDFESTQVYPSGLAYDGADMAPAPEPAPMTEPYREAEAPDDETMALRSLDEAPAPVRGTEPLPPPGPGRAERRRAAKRKGGRAAPAPAAPQPSPTPERPLSRVEARRAARAAKDSFGVVLSRGVGELFITFGVVMLLFVTYQLWWTNVRAGQQTDKAKAEIENSWEQGGDSGAPGAFEPGKGFAIMYIPKLDVVVPVAEGISKTAVLDKGMVGHYGEGRLKTAMPADKQGNFSVAGHRNTHGEPFRYINQLKPGDPIVVETRDAYYTYKMTSILPQTAPSNVSVIDPVPKQSGFTKPGRYITLTTCTPEFTSTYRMIVWGQLADERPRSKGKPAALVG
ncbi:class E sortase [Streptomyces laurentii]|uniref:class E sortase n=1 Tax=Streptomyces laurentii TaxID=39478 RepID=UPI0036A00206